MAGRERMSAGCCAARPAKEMGVETESDKVNARIKSLRVITWSILPGSSKVPAVPEVILTDGSTVSSAAPSARKPSPTVQVLMKCEPYRRLEDCIVVRTLDISSKAENQSSWNGCSILRSMRRHEPASHRSRYFWSIFCLTTAGDSYDRTAEFRDRFLGSVFVTSSFSIQRI